MQQFSYNSRVRCHKKSLADRLEKVVGIEPIHSESAEFDQKYSVYSRDSEFAYDVINPGMMDFLLDKEPPAIEVADTAIGIFHEGRISADRFQWNLDELMALRTHLPGYLFEG